LRRLFSSARLAAGAGAPGRPWAKRADVFLVGLAILGLAFHGASEATRRLHPQPHLKEKMAAATRTVRCFEAIRQQRLGSLPAVDTENDPEMSGLIGQEFTLTTTDRGVLEAKLTSINPNFAALFVEYFHRLGLRPGDPVAIAMTGSFPALNIAVLAAAEEMSLRPLAVTSVGASMWGANDPSFTWLDMEKLLANRGLLHTRSIAASLGGSNDRGRGLSPAGRALLRDAIIRNGVALISEPTLDEAIARRIELLDRAAGSKKIRAYVNIGGSAASIGNQQNGNLIRPGINRTLKPYNWTLRGVLHHYAKRGVPVVHVLGVEELAQAHGFPVAPEVVPAVGEGEIYHREVYDLRIVVPAFLTFVVLCFGVLRSRHQAARAAALEGTQAAAGAPSPPAAARDLALADVPR
jgi:poly-gamma-glutamate system protein